MKTIDGPWENDTITYSYDDLGRVTTIQLENGQTRSLRYDNQGRLTSIIVGDNEYTYTYNDLDLRDSETITGGLPLPQFDEARTESDFNNVNQLLESRQKATPESGVIDERFTYDEDGNMTSGATPEGYTYTTAYDEASRLASWRYTDGSGIVKEKKYTYNGSGFLVKIETFENGSLTGTTRIIRNGFLPVQERDPGNAVIREYVWGKNLGGGIGGLLQLTQDKQNYSFLYDGKGNVVSVLDGSGVEVSQYRYNAFGKRISHTGDVDQPFQFSTKRYDVNTGLVYYGYRFYNPSIERWMNQDQMEKAGGVNLFETRDRPRFSQ